MVPVGNDGVPENVGDAKFAFNPKSVVKLVTCDCAIFGISEAINVVPAVTNPLAS